mmetsp:Transcript_359/g.640  ORF Transcript_359/g.640 Transcript_359/m.640 type:complete len:204 (-) Transcript_359:493-1104(-)
METRAIRFLLPIWLGFFLQKWAHRPRQRLSRSRRYRKRQNRIKRDGIAGIRMARPHTPFGHRPNHRSFRLRRARILPFATGTTNTPTVARKQSVKRQSDIEATFRGTRKRRNRHHGIRGHEPPPKNALHPHRRLRKLLPPAHTPRCLPPHRTRPRHLPRLQSRLHRHDIQNVRPFPSQYGFCRGRCYELEGVVDEREGGEREG